MNVTILKPANRRTSARLHRGLPLLLLWFSATVLGLAQPVPHHFTGMTVLPDKTAMLSLDGSVSNMFNLTGTISNQFRQMFDLYVVEASTNLAAWTRLALLPRTNNDPNPLLFQDTNAAGLSQRFYRTFTNHLLTAFPNPSGPFAVGTVDRVMVDPARTNRYRYSPPTNAFMVTFWYPADPPAAGVLPARMWDQRFAADTSLWSAASGWEMNWSANGYADTQDARFFPLLVAHRFSGVPVASGAGKVPVVLFSTHSSGGRKVCSQIAEELASHGYLVVAMDHTDCYATEFPDGRYLKGGSADVASRLQDMRFLLDQLAVLNGGDPLFAGRLDLDRIGVAGTCIGGMVAEICRSDSRVKCAAIYDADTSYVNRAGLQKPLLAAEGESPLAFYSDVQWLFSKATTNAVWLQIRGGSHMTATDFGWASEILSGCGPARALDACLVWFFDTYLKGEAPPFPTNPEIYNVQRR
jgi:dienelactone hydrolase